MTTAFDGRADRVTTAFRAAVEGLDVDFSSTTRALYAYDASNYRVAPDAVATPRTVDEVRAVLAACREHGVPVTCRGAGTSMAGNAIGEGLVLDFSRHFNRVLEVDTQGNLAVVEPGLVLDDLQRHLAGTGLMFAPDPSSHSRATIGGMVGNDACGNHSVKYGRTVEHLHAVDLVLSDGARVVAEPGGLRPYDPADTHSASRAAQLEDQLRAVVSEHLGPIRLELGRIARQVSGYQLQHLLPESGFDVAKLLAGTEGSCAVIVGLTVKLVPTPPAALLIALGYDDVVEAAMDVPSILRHSPAAVEGMDETIVATMQERRGPRSVAGLPGGRAWLFVELEGADAEQLQRQANELVDELRTVGRLRGGKVVSDPAERSSLWAVRENGAGLATVRSDGTRTWAGWEDSAVAPERLAVYLGDLRELMAEHGLTGAFYGHFGAGCVHVRIDFDLESADGIARMRSFVLEAARLVARHEGSVSGEHGDGRPRSELLAIMYTPTMLQAFGEVKAAFDPIGILNPGMVVGPLPVEDDLAPVLMSPLDISTTAFSYPHDLGGFAGAASRCVGVGKCRSDEGGGMCPSYRVTHDEKDSTRGRSRALQEMIRGDVVVDGWRSTEVLETLDLCLSCKACASDCPVGVDMSTYKSEFLFHHYRGRLRPRSHYSLGWLPWVAHLASLAPRVVNTLMKIAALRRAIAWAGGVTPHRRVPNFASRGSARRALTSAGPDAATGAVLFTDTFTRAFRPELMAAARRSLDAAGVPNRSVEGLCCGLTWISTGQLGIARRTLRRTVEVLDAAGTDEIIVLEPSCAAALRKDAPELLDSDAARRVSRRIFTYAEVLDARLDAGWAAPALEHSVALQVHCHEAAVFGAATQDRVLRRLGATEVVSAEGCCGLAGNFGFERSHYATSIAVADLSLTGALATSAAHSAVVADGFSCQTQIGHVASAPTAPAVHLAELVDAAITAQATTQPATTQEHA